jgi:hypothetical protein
MDDKRPIQRRKFVMAGILGSLYYRFFGGGEALGAEGNSGAPKDTRAITAADIGKPMRLKIISVGTAGEPGGTLVVDSGTGRPIDGVRTVSWCHRAGEFPIARIEVILSDVELDSHGRIRTAVFMAGDGNANDFDLRVEESINRTARRGFRFA